MKKCIVPAICVAFGVLLGKLIPSIGLPFLVTNAQSQVQQPVMELGVVQRMQRLEDLLLDKNDKSKLGSLRAKELHLANGMLKISLCQREEPLMTRSFSWK